MNTPTNKIQILGAGGHAKVVIQTAKAAGLVPVAVFDDDEKLHNKSILGVPVSGRIEDALKIPLPTIIAIGNNQIRKQYDLSLSLPWAVVVHPSAIVDPSVSIGQGTVIFAGVVIQVDTKIGCHAIINTSSSIDHDSLISDYVHIAPGCHLSGGVRVGEGTLLGVGVCVKPCMEIGKWSTIGAGAAVVDTILDHVIALGVPARYNAQK